MRSISPSGDDCERSLLRRAHRARCVVIAGAGVAFCSGGDWVEASEADEGYLERTFALTHEVVEALYTLPCPTIAMIHGATVGAGLELALACDFRLASESASLAVGFTSFAAPPEAISAAMLPRLLGLDQAKRWVFTGARWSGQQAMTNGLVSELLPDHRLRDETLALAAQLARGPTLAYAMGKKLMNDSYEHPVHDTIAGTYRDGIASQGTRDAAESMQAMIDRRTPEFTGD